MGYSRAGFEVIGVDNKPRKNYPFQFILHDALRFLDEMDLSYWDAIAASPPCQAYCKATQITGTQSNHPDLVAPVRERLMASGLPYIIENVPGSPLIDPVTLCGEMFGLKTYRHRLFETNWPLKQPDHPKHTHKNGKLGYMPKDDEYMFVVGNFSGVDRAKEAMGINWMSRDELSQAIPPAYTEYIGHELRCFLER
jgi:DNA (cytosine-5)-methyltransferase 1